MDYPVVKRKIESGDLSPVYFFFGEESYFIDDLSRAVIEKGTGRDTRDFNCDILSGEEVDGEKVVSLASSYPMMSDRRVVVVKAVQKLTPSDKKRVLAYIQDPAETTSLVLTAGKVDRRKSFYAGLTKHALWVECSRLYENQAVDWVIRRCSRAGVPISLEGATCLVEQVGTSIWTLHNEIEKLLTFTWGAKKLGLEQVLAVVGFSRKFNTWELTDSVGNKDLKTAWEILNRLMEAGQSPVGIIMDLSRRFFQLLRIRTLLDRGTSSQEMARVCGLRPYFAKIYIGQARRFTIEDLEKGIRALIMSDFYIKTGRMNPDLALNLAIRDLVRGSSKGRFYAESPTFF